MCTDTVLSAHGVTILWVNDMIIMGEAAVVIPVHALPRTHMFSSLGEQGGRFLGCISVF